MSVRGGTPGVPWSETEVDGARAAPLSSLQPGSLWCWSGRAPTRAAASLPGYAAAGLRAAPERLGRIILSHSTRLYTAEIVQHAGAAMPELLFDRLPPAAPEALSVVDIPMSGDESDRVICFTAGSRIETASGARLVEEIMAGDRLWTLDNGFREVLWVGQRRVTGAAMAARPALRPVRVATDDGGGTRVSPGHRVLTGGEAHLTTARRLGRDRARRELVPAGVVYVHLMLEDHQILSADGLLSESFHPAAMPLDQLAAAERLRLIAARPELELDPSGYGPTARPVTG